MLAKRFFVLIKTDNGNALDFKEDFNIKVRGNEVEMCKESDVEDSEVKFLEILSNL
jgi:hypothetical protein